MKTPSKAKARKMMNKLMKQATGKEPDEKTKSFMDRYLDNLVNGKTTCDDARSDLKMMDDAIKKKQRRGK